MGSTESLFLWAKKLMKKKGKRDNYINTFYTCSLSFFDKIKRNIFKVGSQELNFLYSRFNIFVIYQCFSKVLGIISKRR